MSKHSQAVMKQQIAMQKELLELRRENEILKSQLYSSGIHLRKEVLNDSQFALYFQNVYLGKISRDVDGFYYFLPNDRSSGFWSEHFLRNIARELATLNKDWNDQINNDPRLDQKESE